MRKLGLTAHVVTSVGWLGAVGAFLAVAVAGFRTHDDDIARSAYVSMQLTAWWVIAPLSVLSFVTGLVQALSTPWGLFRHYWVVVKLLINLAATGILMLHMRAIDFMAGQAMSPSFATHDHLPVRLQIATDAVAAINATRPADRHGCRGRSGGVDRGHGAVGVQAERADSLRMAAAGQRVRVRVAAIATTAPAAINPIDHSCASVSGPSTGALTRTNSMANRIAPARIR
jgi:hypothetical protein